MKRVLILYTGGTFGMQGRGKPGLVIPKVSPQILRARLVDRVPEIKRLARCTIKVVSNCDSAHLGPSHWLKLASVIRSNQNAFDGFVILHGTDTMVYSAAALSFLLSPFKKPVILTGAMRPLSEVRTDARRNLISSVELAASSKTPNQVGIFFNDSLFQGNRAQKTQYSFYSAFASLGTDPWAVVGTEIYFDSKPKPCRGANLENSFSPRVISLQARPVDSPGSLWTTLSAVAQFGNIDVVLLEVFASGTGPSHLPEFMEFLNSCKSHGVPTVLVNGLHAASPTQSESHQVYQAAKDLVRAGAVWAPHITPESAYVKASLIAGQSKFQHLQGSRRLKWFKSQFSKNFSNEFGNQK